MKTSAVAQRAGPPARILLSTYIPTVTRNILNCSITPAADQRFGITVVPAGVTDVSRLWPNVRHGEGEIVLL